MPSNLEKYLPGPTMVGEEVEVTEIDYDLLAFASVMGLWAITLQKGLDYTTSPPTLTITERWYGQVECAFNPRNHDEPQACHVEHFYSPDEQYFMRYGALQEAESEMEKDSD